MELVETHAHLDYEVFRNDFPAVLERAAQASVHTIITIATGLASSHAAIHLAEQYDCIYATVGIHPLHAHEEPPSAIDQIAQLASHPKVVAIGEIGLDYFRLPGGPNYNPAHPLPKPEAEKREQAIQIQKQTFLRLLDVARAVGKNVVVHQRASWDDTLHILRSHAKDIQCVLHCFGGTPEQANEVLALGHFVSFTGIVTFKNGRSVRDCAAHLPAGSFFLETDCPYLAPEPHRGKRCEPAHTRIIAESLALARNESLHSLAEHTTRTAKQFFRIS